MSPPTATFSQWLSRTSSKLGIVSCSFMFPVTSFNRTFGLPSELSQAKPVCPHLCDNRPLHSRPDELFIPTWVPLKKDRFDHCLASGFHSRRTPTL